MKWFLLLILVPIAFEFLFGGSGRPSGGSAGTTNYHGDDDEDDLDPWFWNSGEKDDFFGSYDSSDSFGDDD